MRKVCFSVLSILVFATGALTQQRDDPAAIYGAADLVFTGRVEKISPSPGGLSASFEVVSRVKGRIGSAKHLQTFLPIETRCHTLEENHSYLVYAREIGDQLWVDPCNGTKLVSSAEADLRYIHSVNSEISEQCNRNRLAKLARRSQIVVTGEVISTEDSLGNSSLFRPWCGLVFTSEDAYYRVVEVLKGAINDSKITVEHPICWDTITVDGYNPSLSPELFKAGDTLLLFLDQGSHRPGRQGPPSFASVYQDTDENCGAVKADDETASGIADSVRSTPEIYKHDWLDEDVDCLVGANGKTSCVVTKN